MDQLVDEVLTLPYIESANVSRSNTIPIRLMKMATSNDPSAFVTDSEFARGTSWSPYNISGLADSIRSLGDRPRVGRAACITLYLLA